MESDANENISENQQEGKGDAQGKKNKKFNQPRKGKNKSFFKKIKNISKLKCYNIGNKGHFVRD